MFLALFETVADPYFNLNSDVALNFWLYSNLKHNLLIMPLQV